MRQSIILFIAFILFFPSAVFAEEEGKAAFDGAMEETSKEPVVINGDAVEYSETGKTATASGNVVITYRNMKLTCKQAVFHIDTKEVHAEGEVVLAQDKNYLKGERIVYNFDTATGTILSPRVFVDPSFYGGGEKVEKVSDTRYSIKRGYVTTCDKEHPHYRVQSRQVKVYLGDKVAANHILLFAGDVPIFYFPFYSHSLKDKHPGVTLIPGHNKNWGFFLLTSWRYYFHENFRGRVLVDYREKRNFAYGVNLNYAIPGMGDGILRTYLTDEKKNRPWTWQSEDVSPDEDRKRWRAAVRHKWQMDDGTLGTFEVNKMSDADVIKDYFIRDFQRDMVSNTYASIIRTDDFYTTSFLAQKRVNSFDSTVEYLPQLEFTTRSLKIGDTNIYYSGDYSFASLANKIADRAEDDYFAKRVDTINKLEYQMNLMGWLNITPFAGTRQTWYNEDIEDRANVIRGSFFTGSGFNTMFSRVYDVKSDILGINIDRLRHIISPTATYNYNRRPTVVSGKLKQFDGVDSLGFTNAVSPSIESKLQTKRTVDGRLESVDIAMIRVGTVYNFGFDEKKGGRLANYDLSFESKPYNWMKILSNSVYNPHDAKFESCSFNIANDPYGAIGSSGLRQAVYTDLEKEKWSYGAGYRWNNNLNSQLEGELMFNVTPKWKVTTYQRFDLKSFVGDNKKLINNYGEQEYRITRDLHCWVGEFVYNISRDSGHTVWFVFRLKAFPDMPFEFEKRYYHPSFGASMPGK